MVALMCACCVDKYVPSLKFFRSGPVEDYTRFNGIVYNSYSFKLNLNCGLGLYCDYFFVYCLFFRPSDSIPDDLAEIPFPLSNYDYIEIYIVKPEFVGLDITSLVTDGDDGIAVYDIYKIPFSDFNNPQYYIDLLMERLSPLLLSKYFYYSNTIQVPGDDYARSYTYDEFIADFRGKINEVFYFFKNGRIIQWESPLHYPRLFSYSSSFKFMVEKELHINADI